MPEADLVLASGSPRRRELLAALHVPFRAVPSTVEEAADGAADPGRLAERLAFEKAREVAARTGAPLVLGADTVVALDGAILGKPRHPDEAARMLRDLRGRPHHVTTGVALLAGRRQGAARATTLVTMRRYTDQEIAAYVASGDPMDKAGAYAIQHPGFRPVAGIEGCYCNVVGLPLWPLVRLLRSLAPGLPVADPSRAFDRCAACPLRHPD